MIIGSRLKERIEARRSSQAELARVIGITPQAVSKMINGGTTDTAKLYQIARFLQTSPEYLSGETDDPAPQQLGEHRRAFHGAEPEPERDPDSVIVQELDLAFGMGGGTYLDMPVKAEPVSFSRIWLRNFTKSPVDALFFARGMGDSMEPTIADADIVLIDSAQQTPRMGDQIWAIDFGGVGMIKRLRPMPDGTVKIQSDNPRIRDEVAHDGEMNVIGRVVAIVRKV